MNPSGIERIVAVADFQEAGRLHERRFAEARHFFELLAVAKRPVCLAMIVHPPRRQLVQPANIPQQRRAGGIQIDAHVVDARFDHRIQRRAQMLGLHVVLIQPDADAARVDFHQFAQADRASGGRC